VCRLSCTVRSILTSQSLALRPYYDQDQEPGNASLNSFILAQSFHIPSHFPARSASALVAYTFSMRINADIATQPHLFRVVIISLRMSLEHYLISSSEPFITVLGASSTTYGQSLHNPRSVPSLTYGLSPTTVPPPLSINDPSAIHRQRHLPTLLHPPPHHRSVTTPHLYDRLSSFAHPPRSPPHPSSTRHSPHVFLDGNQSLLYKVQCARYTILITLVKLILSDD
jgi:hypothetical protein